jgi:hypothetical protein
VTIDAATGNITLSLGRRLPTFGRFLLRVSAAPPNGVTDMFGHPLDGNYDGVPGGDYVARLDRRPNSGH